MKTHSILILGLIVFLGSCKEDKNNSLSEINNSVVVAQVPPSTTAGQTHEPQNNIVEQDKSIDTEGKVKGIKELSEQEASPAVPKEQVLKNTNVRVSTVRVGGQSKGQANVEAVLIGGDPNEYMKNRKKTSTYTTVQVGATTPKNENEKTTDDATVKEELDLTKEPLKKAKEINDVIDEVNQKASVSGPPSHSDFNTLLNQFVSNGGMVNYSAFKKDVRFEVYLKALSTSPPESSWSRNEKLAYWINTYNAFTIKKIVDNYPVSSITDLDGGKPWDKKWIEIGGKKYSLNDIENSIIRPQFKEPRIHFAVNCAALSCPPLANEAFTASNLNQLLEKQTKAFVNNDKSNSISEKKVSISKIFEWYGEDFGNLIGFLNKYSSVKIKDNAKVEFKDYNWALNKS